jgi:hypothetical protein
MRYAYTLTSRSISVIIGARVLQTDRSNPGFARIKELLNDPDADEAELIALFAPIEVVSRLSTRKVTVKDGMVFWGDDPIHTALTRRMVDVMNEGLDIEPWVKFATNVYDNPSPMARTELYEFLERADCPITPDGCFLAYKKVRADFMDCHTGTFDNSVGQYVSMPRDQVDPIRGNVCSTGLHFCSKRYLPQTPGQVTLLLKINPRDVVSIPTDYDQSKGRTCAYEVVGVIDEGLAGTITWDPIVASHGEFRWGWDENEPEFQDDLDVEDAAPVEYVESVSHGKITAAKFEQLLKKYGTQAGIARALGMSSGTIQKWKARLGV